MGELLLMPPTVPSAWKIQLQNPILRVTGLVIVAIGILTSRWREGQQIDIDTLATNRISRFSIFEIPLWTRVIPAKAGFDAEYVEIQGGSRLKPRRQVNYLRPSQSLFDSTIRCGSYGAAYHERRLLITAVYDAYRSGRLTPEAADDALQQVDEVVSIIGDRLDFPGKDFGKAIMKADEIRNRFGLPNRLGK